MVTFPGHYWQAVLSLLSQMMYYKSVGCTYSRARINSNTTNLADR